MNGNNMYVQYLWSRSTGIRSLPRSTATAIRNITGEQIINKNTPRPRLKLVSLFQKGNSPIMTFTAINISVAFRASRALDNMSSV